ncbi:MAG: non-homologous end-joining DNA ligase, partial [Natronospirillum sp.]
MAEQLKTYREKRNFKRTTEPAGSLEQDQKPADTPDQPLAVYIMHLHAASHDHFDLRLEQDGVLRSWALPKGPSLTPGEKRLAVEVEDHPLEYGEFEGVIPKEEYGGGTVMLWDRGHWRPHGKLKADKIDFELTGEKLTGHWTLVKMRGNPGSRNKKDNSWLLIKRNDPGATPLEPDDISVASGRTMTEITHRKPARDYTTFKLTPETIDNARHKSIPKALQPQLATLVNEAPKGDDWLHEIKLDGYRLMAYIEAGKVRLLTRNGKDWTRKFHHLAQTLAQLPVHTALLDGEIIWLTPDGASSFVKLQDSLSNAATDALTFQVFDLLYWNHHDLQATPLLARKQALQQVLEPILNGAGTVRYSDHVVGRGPEFYNQVCELGLEGMVAKKADSPYRSGRHKTWLKIKCTAQDEFVIGGFTKPSGARQGFGA